MKLRKGWRISSAPLYIALLILQTFRHFTYGTTHSRTLPSLYLRNSSFSNPSVASPITVHFPSLLSLRIRRSRAHSPTFPSLHLCHNSFSNPSVPLPTSQLILQPFRCFTHVTQFILQHFFRFSYVTSSSLNSPGEPPMTETKKQAVSGPNLYWQEGCILSTVHHNETKLFEFLFDEIF